MIARIENRGFTLTDKKGKTWSKKMNELRYLRLGGILAVVLLVAALVLVATDFLGLPLLSGGNLAGGYLSAGNFAAGYLAAGDFSVGVFAAGIFSVGVFSIGVFSIGIFSVGIFNIGLFAVGICAIGRYKQSLILGEAERAKQNSPATT